MKPGGQLGKGKFRKRHRVPAGAPEDDFNWLKGMFETRTNSPKSQAKKRRAHPRFWPGGSIVAARKAGCGAIWAFIPLILIAEKLKFARTMNPDEQSEGRPEGAEDKPAPSVPSNEGQRRPEGGRPRFRGGRGRGRGGRGGGRAPRPDDRAERPAPKESGEPHAPASVRTAIEELEEVQSDLEKVLEDINEILRVLEQADRDRSASEREIAVLRDTLRRLRGDRGGGGQRQPRNPPPEPPTHASDEATMPDPEESEDDEAQGHDNPA
jgi:hypothetical protein